MYIYRYAYIPSFVSFRVLWAKGPANFRDYRRFRVRSWAVRTSWTSLVFATANISPPFVFVSDLFHYTSLILVLTVALPIPLAGSYLARAVTFAVLLAALPIPLAVTVPLPSLGGSQDSGFSSRKLWTSKTGLKGFQRSCSASKWNPGKT